MAPEAVGVPALFLAHLAEFELLDALRLDAVGKVLGGALFRLGYGCCAGAGAGAGAKRGGR